MAERDRERCPVVGDTWDDDRLESGRRERALRCPRTRLADRVADLDAAETPELADLPGGNRCAPDGRSLGENRQRGDLRLVVFGNAVAAEREPVTNSDRPREQA